MKFPLKPLLLATAALAVACGEKYDFRTASFDPVASGGRVKFYHAAPGAPGVVVYLNDKPFSGVNTTPPAAPLALTYSNTALNSFPNIDYAVVAPGTAKVRVATAATATVPEATVFTGDVPVQDNTYYSVFVVGSAPNYEAVLTTDKLQAADATKAYVRVANLVPNSPAGGYELLVNAKSVVTAGAYKTVTEFQPVDAVAFGATALTVAVRNGASSFTATGGLSPLAGRFYTIVVRGVAGSTATPVAVAVSTNR